MKEVSIDLSGLKFLVVEDDGPTASRLKRKIEEAFTASVITLAHTVEEAKRVICNVDRDNPFDVAIVDFKLPKNSLGEEPEFSFEVSFYLNRMPWLQSTILVHITAYDKDPEIVRFMENRDAYFQQKQILIAKDGTSGKDWFAELIKAVKSCFHTRRVRGKLDQLFGEAARERQRHRYYGPGMGGRIDRGRGLEVFDLCADGQTHWNYLTDELKAELKQCLGFATSASGEPILGVIMIDESPSQENKS